MKLKKKLSIFLQIGRKIYHRSGGQITAVTGLFYLLILVVVVAAQLQLAVFRGISTYAEDALAASTLACAVIDLQEYGRTHHMIIDPANAYVLFQELLAENLVHEKSGEADSPFFLGDLKIEEFRVYNV
ncbi:MAG: hypothetical protein LBM60_06385, partial [Clostridium sp.]|nr:hypothetical protein [Clostridium sp.]